MGKRRRDEAEDDVSTKKNKRKRHNSEDEELDSSESRNKRVSFAPNGSHDNGSSNGLHDTSIVSTIDDPDAYAIYLIRKPASMSLDDLSESLKLRSKAKEKKKQMTIGDEDFDVSIAPNNGNMYHVELSGDPKNIRAGPRIVGTVTIAPTPQGIDMEHLVAHDDFLEDPPADTVMPFTIAPIKRKPVLEMDSLKQRLHAYGCPPTETEGHATAERKKNKKKRKSKRASDDEEE